MEFSQNMFSFFTDMSSRDFFFIVADVDGFLLLSGMGGRRRPCSRVCHLQKEYQISSSHFGCLLLLQYKISISSSHFGCDRLLQYEISSSHFGCDLLLQYHISSESSCRSGMGRRGMGGRIGCRPRPRPRVCYLQ
uniref:Uncharacterized protein n=1 Tax=Lotus japonicus TaxID=34305 RepID=I3S0G5_LOTJA|nr:unknown [Lotus japonicus]